MAQQRLVVGVLALISALVSAGPARAQFDFKCDPVDPQADVGWSVVPSLETVEQTDSAPFQVGTDWYVTRTSTKIPFCNYYNDLGIYSLRSYTLARRISTERLAICKDTPAGGSVAVAPYAGPCPPK